MNSASTSPESQWTFEAINRDVQALRELLISCGLPPVPGGALEQAANDARELWDSFAGRSIHNRTRDHRPAWRRAVGLADLARKILAVVGHKDFEQLRGHLELLTGKEEFSLHDATEKENRANNQVFELFVATGVMRFASDIQVEEPNPKKALKYRNPDVLATWSGQRWGFACKALHSEHPEALIENLRKGVKQIDASDATAGMVLLNMKNLVPHDLLWPADLRGGSWEYASYDGPSDVRDRFTELFNGHLAEIFVHACGRDIAKSEDLNQSDLDTGKKNVAKLFENSKTSRLLPQVWLGVAGTHMPDTGARAISNYRLLLNFEFEPISPDEREVLEALCKAMQGRDPLAPEPALGE